MAIKAGQILHDANGFVVDRIQTGGVGSLNIPEEKIYELGNYQTVATIRDIPDLSFDMESLDVSPEIETVLVDNVGAVAGTQIDFAKSKPLDVISPFKSAQGAFDAIRGLVIPHLTLENVTYRFGTRANATKAFTLRGDAIYYIPGSPYYQEFAGTGVATAFAFTNTALAYVESGVTKFALSVTVQFADGNSKRLFRGPDYTDTATGITLTSGALAPSGSTIKVTYGSATIATYAQTVHQGVGVKPAAVRGKDIDVYINQGAATPTLVRWGGVQSFEVTRRVNLDNDEEFGNRHYVSQDYDTADVTGSITIRPRDLTDLWNKIHQVADVPNNQVVGPYTSTPLAVEIRINDPETGNRLETLYVPDARFQVPALQGRVQTKLETTFNFTSDGGSLFAYVGARP